MPKKITREEVEKRNKNKYGDKFKLDLSNYEKYQGEDAEININCPIHGNFKKSPKNFLDSTHGCSKCGLNMTTETEFFKKSKIKFKNKFNLSKVNFNGFSGDEVNIECPEHGWFIKTPFDFLDSKHGCSDCAKEEGSKAKNEGAKNSFVKKAKERHGEDNNYDKTIYISVYEKVTIKCNKCEKYFSLMANSHLNGSNCSCRNSSRNGFDPNKPAILYYLKHIESGYYKSGITNRTLKDRFGPKLKEVKIINIKDFDLGKDAYLEEQEILKKYDKHRIRFDEFGTGVTEFFNKDVLRLDIL